MKQRQRPVRASIGLVVLAALSAPSVGAEVTERVSVSSTGLEANDDSRFRAAISADGRFVAFTSFADNLVPGDTNRAADIFVRDRQTGTTERVSVSSSGLEGNAESLGVAISADGRFVVFPSSASNLVPGDTNGAADVFVRDRQTGTTERVSVSSSGLEGNAESSGAAISADGRFVVFTSGASDLVPGDTNLASDVFVRDRQTGTTERVSVSSSGVQATDGSAGTAISADGRFVVFDSPASNLVPGDTDVAADVFVRDRQTGTTERVSVSSNGLEADRTSGGGTISADGRFVAFGSAASNLVPGEFNDFFNVFVRDRLTGTTERVTGGDDQSFGEAISADGRFVAFTSFADNLVPGDTNRAADVFVRDRQTGTTERVSVSSSGVQADSASGPIAISADGRFVAFTSFANNLVPGDTNGAADVFVRVRSAMPMTTTTMIATTTTTTTTTAPPGGSTTTTSIAPSTTTTLPCATTRCTLEAARTSAPCAGEAIPPAVTAKLDRAVSLIDQAGTTSPARKATKLLKKAKKALKQAEAKANRATKGKNPKLSPGCAAALKAAADGVLAGLGV